MCSAVRVLSGTETRMEAIRADGGLLGRQTLDAWPRDETDLLNTEAWRRSQDEESLRSRLNACVKTATKLAERETQVVLGTPW